MINGIINIYKEKGLTSHDVVQRLRAILRQKKIGHTGTLDPDAEGVLPVCLGTATRAFGFLQGGDKTYDAVMLLGKTTDTQDITGKVLREEDACHIADETIEETIKSYVGAYEQLPPMYSAVRVGGKRLYESAREGVEVPRDTRTVTIYSINILDILPPRVRMEVNCSKGTYIRTLCHDIGNSLGCGACMESLTRTRAGRFLAEHSLKIADIENYMENGTFMEHVLPVDRIFDMFPALYLSGSRQKAAYNGNMLSAEGIMPPDFEKARVYDSSGRFIAVYGFDKEAGLLRPETMFFDKNGQP